MKKIIALCLAVIMVVGLFAGCGNKNGGDDDGVKTLIMRTETAFTTLDPAYSNNTHDIILYDQVYDGLYGMDEAHGGYYAELAEKVEANADSTAYTVTLRDGIKFANGDPVTAQDCVFTFERAMESAAMSYLVSMIESVEAPDDKTFVMNLKYAYAPIAHTLFRVKIVSEKEVTEQGDKFGTIPNTAGAGPYYVSEFDIATGAKLTANPHYYQGEPNIKAVDYRVYSDPSAAVIAFENGELDFYDQAALTDWDSLKAASGENNTMVVGNNITWFGINYASPTNDNILGNDLVRQAIFYAINKEDVNLAVCEGYGRAATTYMVPEFVPTQPTEGFEAYDFNVQKAKDLLAQAGYPDGADIGTILTSTSANSSKTAQVIQAALAAVGLKAECEFLDVSVYVERTNVQDFDLTVYGDSGNYDFNNIRQQVHSESFGMYVIDYRLNDKFDYERIEYLVEAGAAVADLDSRMTYYNELWTMIMDTATILPLINRPVAMVWAEDLDIGDPVPTYYKIKNFSWVEG